MLKKSIFLLSALSLSQVAGAIPAQVQLPDAASHGIASIPGADEIFGQWVDRIPDIHDDDSFWLDKGQSPTSRFTGINKNWPDLGLSGAGSPEGETSPISESVTGGSGETGGQILPAPVSTIPVPAAAWLFGSAMLGLIGLKRKR